MSKFEKIGLAIRQAGRFVRNLTPEILLKFFVEKISCPEIYTWIAHVILLTLRLGWGLFYFSDLSLNHQ